jgi:hypothetical protein
MERIGSGVEDAKLPVRMSVEEVPDLGLGALRRRSRLLLDLDDDVAPGFLSERIRDVGTEKSRKLFWVGLGRKSETLLLIALTQRVDEMPLGFRP